MQSPLQSSLSIVAGSSSVASDYGSDTAYEPSDLGKPRIGWDDNSEVSTDRWSNIRWRYDESNRKACEIWHIRPHEGLLMGQTILHQLEGLPRHKAPWAMAAYFIGKGFLWV